jgi:hypothetical protein
MRAAQSDAASLATSLVPVHFALQESTGLTTGRSTTFGDLHIRQRSGTRRTGNRTRLPTMRRVVLFGPGGAGKTTVGRRLSEATGIPFVEIDNHFWDANLQSKPRDEWIESQKLLLVEDTWILDGDLGPYDAPEVRIKAADTIIVLDLPRWLCLWRSVRRSRERMDYWRWVWSWRRKYKPAADGDDRTPRIDDQHLGEGTGERGGVIIYSLDLESAKMPVGVRISRLQLWLVVTGPDSCGVVSEVSVSTSAPSRL